MSLNNINKNRQSLWLQERSSAKLALMTVECGHAFLWSIAANKDPQRFAADKREAKRQLGPAREQSIEISNGSFDNYLLLIKDKPFFEMFRFIQRSFGKIIFLFTRLKTKQGTAYKRYATKSKLTGCVILLVVCRFLHVGAIWNFFC